MNLFLLLAGLRPWSEPPAGAFSRVAGAVAALSIEMQLVTWSGYGSLSSLPLLNAVLAAALWLHQSRFRQSAAIVAAPAGRVAPSSATRAWSALPWPVLLALSAISVALAVTRPLEGADPYHLERVAQIARLGTLAFAGNADIKVDVLGSPYELVLADLGLVPWAGPYLIRLHGVLGLAYLALGVAVIRQWLTGGSTWAWSAPFLMPVVFHQLVLVKNDLFSATPALVALCWAVARAPAAPPREVTWASGLVGFAVGLKWVSFPLALIMVVAVLARGGSVWRSSAALILGGAAGGIAGGLPFTLIETARWYGHPVAVLATLGNRTTGAADAATSVARFAISLVDFGVLTRQWWPGRGGWGATFGAPFIWALAVVAVNRGRGEARRVGWMALVYFAAFAAVYPDADVAHRLALAPGLLLVACAAHLTGPESPAWQRRGLQAALAVSIAQIARSALIYLSGPV